MLSPSPMVLPSATSPRRGPRRAISASPRRPRGRAAARAAAAPNVFGVPADEDLLGYYVRDLYCSLHNEDRYAAGELHNLSRAGKPLLVQYDLEKLKGKLTRELLASRAPTLWKWRELLPVRHFENCVTLGEWATPVVKLPKLGVLVKDEGRLPTGSFKARGLVMAVSMAKELGT